MEWISVNNKEVLAPKNTDFLVLFENGEVRRFFEDFPTEVVTHWCLFPKLPEPPTIS